MKTRTASTKMGTIAAAVVAACALALPATVAGQIPPWQAGRNGAVKTKVGNPQAIQAFQDVLFKFDEEGKANRGRPSANAKAQVQKLQAAAGRAKGEIRAFTARLKAAGEVQAFDAAVEARAKQAGSAELLSELRAAGGGYALLQRGDQYIDEMIVDRRRVVEKNGVAARIEAWLGVAEVHALRQTACGAFWWVITVGYGERFAYRSCYY